MTRLADAESSDGFRVHVGHFGPSSRLGRHPTRLWQLFGVMSGRGWVSGPDGVVHTISRGQAVLWPPGEDHESGSDDGMIVVIVAAPRRPV